MKDTPHRLNANFAKHSGAYLRLSVTDRCNLRCAYCMPPSGMDLFCRSQIRSIEETAHIVRRLAELVPLAKLRLTGGEPLVRKGILKLIRLLNDLPSQPALLMTTNGTLLHKFAPLLREAGISRLNISLDTLKPERFNALTGGQLEQALVGIERARLAGFTRIKLNTVLLRGINDDELLELTHFAISCGYDIRFIELMPVGPWKTKARQHYLSADSAMRILGPKVKLTSKPEANTTATMMAAEGWGYKGKVGFISPVSHPFCSSCNRLRIDALGRLHPCLMSDRLFDLAGLIDSGASHPELEESLMRWLEVKRSPLIHPLNRDMSSIGG